MSSRRPGLGRIAGAPLDLAALRSALAVPGDFAAVVRADAAAAAARVVLPDADATDIPLVTVDPPGSRDLDQAVHLSRDGDGYLVVYAIADVAAFVSPGSALDREAHARGETLYFPDLRVPLYPAELSEGAASLLPDQIRPAVVWRIGLDAAGAVRSVHVARSRVRSRAQLDYPSLQAELDAGRGDDAVRLLPEIGRLRLAAARARHAIELNSPEQEVEPDGTGGWRIVARVPAPVEQWNAEISLLTGMCAAAMMIEHRVGILRTLPPPDDRTVAELRAGAAALGVDWPDGAAPGDVLATLDPPDPRQAAFVEHAGSLLRGAAYTVLAGSVPELHVHAGVQAPYAHVTAPLRRLVDRYGSTLCAELAAGRPAPDWIVAALPALPDEMARADRLAHEVDRAVVDATEAWLLRGRIGETFAAVVLSAHGSTARIVLDDPVVRASCDGTGLQAGQRIRVRLDAADVERRSVHFTAVAG